MIELQLYNKKTSKINRDILLLLCQNQNTPKKRKTNSKRFNHSSIQLSIQTYYLSFAAWYPKKPINESIGWIFLNIGVLNVWYSPDNTRIICLSTPTTKKQKQKQKQKQRQKMQKQTRPDGQVITINNIPQRLNFKICIFSQFHFWIM